MPGIDVSNGRASCRGCGLGLEDMSEIRKEYDKLKAAMTATAPFISSLLGRTRIVLSRSVPTAGVSSRGVMTINPDFWASLSWAGRAWILGHETLHIAFRDHKRIGSRNPVTWNMVSDAVNNEMERELIRAPDEIEESAVFLSAVFYDFKDYFESLGFTCESLKKLSKEEVYRILPKMPESQGASCPSCGSPGIRITSLNLDDGTAELKCDGCGHKWSAKVEIGLGGSGTPIPVEKVTGDLVVEGEGEVLQEGDPEIYKNGEESDGEDTDEKWRERVATAYEAQKTIGTIPAGLRRLVDALLKPKVDWRNLLRQSFKVGLGRSVVSTWKRPSRKNPEDFPGTVRFTYPTVWCLIDESGSIGDSEAAQFLSEVYSISGQASVACVCWDSEAYEVVKANSRQEVVGKVLGRLRGGGGTVIAPVLRKTLLNMKPKDVVAVFTDGEIYDLESGETKQLFSSVASKAGVAVMVSTNREVEIPMWRFVKLET